MPKRAKRTKNTKNKKHIVEDQLITKTDNQEYAKVTQIYGGGRVQCTLVWSEKTRLGIIRNTMRRGRKNRVAVDDIVLVSLRDFQEDKVDIIHVYTPAHVTRLMTLGAIPWPPDDDQTVFEPVDSWEPELSVPVDLDRV